MSGAVKDHKTQRHRLAYRRRMAVSLGMSLTLIVLLFVVLPRQFPFSQPRPLPEVVSLKLDDIRAEAPAPALPARMTQPLPQAEPVVDAEPEATLPEMQPQQSGIADGDSLGWGVAAGGVGTGVGAAGDTIPPRPIIQSMPDYPKEEKKRRVSGVVRLSVYIDTGGRVINITVVENTTGSKLCEQAAIEAARRSRYQPATVGNRPVVARTVCEYGFRPE